MHSLLQAIRKAYRDETASAIQGLETKVDSARAEEHRFRAALESTEQTIRDAEITRLALEAINQTDTPSSSLKRDYRNVQGLLKNSKEHRLQHQESLRLATARREKAERALSALKAFQGIPD